MISIGFPQDLHRIKLTDKHLNNMGKAKLTSIFRSMTGKISKKGTICLRQTPSGQTSFYEIEVDAKKQFNSPAQQLHRQKIAQASRTASTIMHDPQYASLLAQYQAEYESYNLNHPAKPFYSLQRFIVHHEYLNLKNS